MTDVDLHDHMEPANYTPITPRRVTVTISTCRVRSRLDHSLTWTGTGAAVALVLAYSSGASSPAALIAASVLSGLALGGLVYRFEALWACVSRRRTR